MTGLPDYDDALTRRSPDAPASAATPVPPVTPANPAPASWTALQIARIALRWSRYPGRGWIGAARRKVSRRRGGQRFTVPTDDGITLDAWYSPAPAHRRRADRLPVVMMHGWIEVKEFHFPRAWRLNQAGHDVILFDHRAHGRSTGVGATFGARERRDLATVIDQARQRGHLDQRYITMGFSMGGAVALQHAADDPNIAGVVALAPYLDFERALCSFREKLAPWMDEKWLVAGFERAACELGFCFDDASTLEAVRRLEAPVLLIEAVRDSNLPPAAHTRMLAAAKTCGPLECFSVDHATHINLCRQAWPGLEQRITDFCKSLR